MAVVVRATASTGSRGTDPALEARAEALHAALSVLLRVYQLRDRDRICCHDVSVTQCYAIEALVRRGPSTLNALAAELLLEKSTASRVVATLERKGYVARALHPDDGRAVVLRATGAGRRLHDRIHHDLVAEEKELLRDFEPKVREAASSLILRLARAAARRCGAGPARLLSRRFDRLSDRASFSPILRLSCWKRAARGGRPRKGDEAWKRSGRRATPRPRIERPRPGPRRTVSARRSAKKRGSSGRGDA